MLGFSEDEKTCSRILAFYFNPLEEHGLKDMFLKAFINVLDNKGLIKRDNFSFDNVEIIRELQTNTEKTDSENRIDIVIRSKDYVIGIENKVNDNVDHNDLNDYSNKLNELASNVIKIVFSKKKQNKMDYSSGFSIIKYSEFAIELEKEMEKVKDKQSVWYLFLEEFLLTFLTGNIVYYYYSKSHPNDDFAKIDDDIDYKINQFVKLTKNRISKYKEKHVHSVKLDLTSYIRINGFNLDARLTVYGWKIGVYEDINKKVLPMRDFLEKNHIKVLSEHNQRFIFKEFDYDEDIEVVANYYIKMFNIFKDTKF